MEADLVAHCGQRPEGAFLHTLVLTDVATGWTECLPLLFRTQAAVVQALGRVRRLLPMALLGLDTDNGSEFLNAELIGYCARERITFTRGRAYKKNDQCFVEQKNGSIVRHLVGYDRFEGEATYRQLAELYRGVRLYVNFFQPSMKLSAKYREGSRVRRSYDAAQTPYQRLVRSGVLSQDSHDRLPEIHDALDPVRLLGQIGTLQDALWRHAVVSKPANLADSNETNSSALPAPVKFLAAAGGPTGEETVLESMTPPPTPSQRKYRRLPKPRAPHTWRTRPDPFEAVWGEITQRLAERPELTGRLILDQLQKQYPGEYPDNQLRTLQRRVKEWRAGALIQFDDAWLGEAELAGITLPNPLRARLDAEIGHPLESTVGVRN